MNALALRRRPTVQTGYVAYLQKKKNFTQVLLKRKCGPENLNCHFWALGSSVLPGFNHPLTTKSQDISWPSAQKKTHQNHQGVPNHDFLDFSQHTWLMRVVLSFREELGKASASSSDKPAELICLTSAETDAFYLPGHALPVTLRPPALKRVEQPHPRCKAARANKTQPKLHLPSCVSPCFSTCQGVCGSGSSLCCRSAIV